MSKSCMRDADAGLMAETYSLSQRLPPMLSSLVSALGPVTAGYTTGQVAINCNNGFPVE